MRANGVVVAIAAAVGLFVSGGCLILAYAFLMPAVQYSFGLAGLIPPWLMLAVAVAGPLYVLFALTRLRSWPLSLKMAADLVVAAALLAGLYAWLSPRTERSILTPAYGQALSAACRGQAVEAAAYRAGPGPHPIVVLTGSGPGIYKGFPPEWTPARPEQVELVACVGAPERVVLETCRYESGSDVTRYGYQAPVRVVAAATGETVKEFVAHADPPQPCAFREKSSVSSLTGASFINEANLLGELQPVVLGGAE